MEAAPQRLVGSMGSQYASFRVPREYIPRMAGFDWNSVARRVFIDPVTGLIALMSPSSEHERYAGGADRLADRLGAAYGIRVLGLRSTRWRRPGDPENTGAEPDACYYLGETALAWDRADREGLEALEAFEARTPPDLVIEVERSRGDGRKPGFYREVGAREMWRLDIGPDGRQMDILDLQAPDGPALLAASSVLPLCTPAFVLEALEPASRGRLAELDALIARSAETPAPEDEGDFGMK